MNDLIEKLKDKDYVRAFGLMKPEEQEVLESVGWQNRLVYILNKWRTDSGKIKGNEREDLTYAIKPDYQPEPEPEPELDKGLYEELRSIVIASIPGNGKEPVWDGSVIGKPNQHTLVKMGLVECFRGYYFPTQKGREVYKNYQPEPEPEPKYVNLEIEEFADGENTKWLGVWNTPEAFFLPHQFTHLHCLPSLPNFDGFYTSRAGLVEVDFQWVSRHMPGVVARFRK